jgi:hypothetical protein
MTNRSVTRRNFWGGFWGGVVGVFATANVGVYSLVLGCLVGVVSGFYYQEIWQIAKESWQKQTAVPAEPTRTMRQWWNDQHPYERALMLKNLTRSIAMLLPFAALQVAMLHSFKHAPTRVDFGILAFGMLMATGVSFMYHDAGVREPEKGWTAEDMRAYFGLQERYLKGSAQFFVWELAKSLSVLILAVAGLVALVNAEMYFVLGVLSLVGLVGAVPTAWFAVVSIVRGVYQLAMRSDHWVCLIVTTTVTAGVVILAKDALQGPTLGLTALTAGIASGAGSVQAHRMLRQWCESDPRIMTFFRLPVREHRKMLFEAVRALTSPADYQLTVRAVIAADVK